MACEQWNGLDYVKLEAWGLWMFEKDQGKSYQRKRWLAVTQQLPYPVTQV